MHTHMATTTKLPTKPKSRYRGGRRARTVVLSDALVEVAQDFFAIPATQRGGARHNSMSSLLDAGLSSFIRKNAAKIRKAGIAIPECVFADA